MGGGGGGGGRLENMCAAAVAGGEKGGPGDRWQAKSIPYLISPAACTLPHLTYTPCFCLPAAAWLRVLPSASSTTGSPAETTSHATSRPLRQHADSTHPPIFVAHPHLVAHGCIQGWPPT